MNAVLYQAARAAGCSRAEAEALALYVELDSGKAVAVRMGVRAGTVYQYFGQIKDRLDVPHVPAAIAKLLG